MPGIHPSIIYHKLAIFPKAKPISQKKRKMGDERHKMVREEVDKLLKPTSSEKLGIPPSLPML